MSFAPTLLKGKRVLVIGASGGAGRAVAKLVAECGGHCDLVGRDPEKIERVKNELSGTGHRTNHETVDAEPWSGIFHGAAVEMLAPLSMSAPETVEKVFGPSFNKAVEILRMVASRKGSCLRDGGSVVFMSSVAVSRGTPGMSLYASSKGAIEALVTSAAVELAPRRIRVNAIRAGAFSSPMHERLVGRLNEVQLDAYVAKHPLGIGKSDDIANMAVYLMSDMARWVTGSILTVDGGYSAK